MANTYTSLHYHVIFSTKNRVNWIKPDIESRIWSYIGGIARMHKMTALQIGGTDDHVHALVQAPPIYSPSEIAQYLKGESSKWIHEEFPSLHGFGWQDGYGAFTVSKSDLPEVIRYIQNQREHHHKKTFKRNIWSSSVSTALNTTNVTCGVDSGVATRRAWYLISSCTGLERPA